MSAAAIVTWAWMAAFFAASGWGLWRLSRGRLRAALLAAWAALAALFVALGARG